MLLKQADFLLKELRRGLKIYLSDARIPEIKSGEKWLNEKRGAFVTVLTYPERDLRGCIGYIAPEYSLKEIAMKSAISAAFDDSRFPPVTEDELERVILELSVLSDLAHIRAASAEEIMHRVELGKDGLVVQEGAKLGLLLPQVAIESRMNKQEFLSHCCIKAGLPPSAWRDQKVSISKFQAEIFSETEPGGPVVSNGK